jgi:hypothetical protein
MYSKTCSTCCDGRGERRRAHAHRVAYRVDVKEQI